MNEDRILLKGIEQKALQAGLNAANMAQADLTMIIQEIADARNINLETHHFDIAELAKGLLLVVPNTAPEPEPKPDDDNTAE